MRVKNYTDLQIRDMIQYVRKFGVRCKHGHPVTSHPNCLPAAITDRICFLDCEWYGHDADWGEMLCWVIMDALGNTEWDVRKNRSDKSVVASCLKALKKFDVVIGHYSRKGDVPYILTRALWNGLEIPHRSEFRQMDLWRFCKDRLKLSHNSQAILAVVLRGQTRKMPVISRAWSKAVFQGDKKALASILEHCKADVLDLYENYQGVKKQLGKAIV